MKLSEWAKQQGISYKTAWRWFKIGRSTIKTIVVEHRDRLMRFGCEYVEAALLAQGRKILVVDSGEVKDDLVRDMVEVLTSFCARLYGRRAAKNKAEKALKAMETKDNDEVK